MHVDSIILFSFPHSNVYGTDVLIIVNELSH